MRFLALAALTCAACRSPKPPQNAIQIPDLCNGTLPRWICCTGDEKPIFPPYNPPVTWKYASQFPESLSEPADYCGHYSPILPGTIGYSHPSRPGHDLAIVDTWGWLSDSMHGCNDDPDWTYEFEIDPEATSIDLNALYKVGNVISIARGASSPDRSYHQIASTPQIHVEIRGWIPRRHDNVEVSGYGWVTNPHCTNKDGDVWFAYDPDLPTDGAPSGRLYVHIVGLLTHDGFHITEDQHVLANAGDLEDVKKIWGGCHELGDCKTHERDPDNLARWYEIHSPDLIEPVPDQEQHRQREVVRAVLVTADHGVFSGETRRIEEDIYPCPDDPTRPCAAPGPGYTVAYKEYVDPVTNYRSITDGSCGAGGCTGARVQLLADHIHVSVQVHGGAANGPYGKFKALYRVMWAQCGCDGAYTLPGPQGGSARCTPPSCPPGQMCSGSGCTACSDADRARNCAMRCNAGDGCGGTCTCAADHKCVPMPLVGGECMPCMCKPCGGISPLGCSCPNTCPAAKPDCAPDGSCTCTPRCAGKCSGEADGCGGACPSCDSLHQCVNGACQCKSPCKCNGRDVGCLDPDACQQRCGEHVCPSGTSWCECAEKCLGDAACRRACQL